MANTSAKETGIYAWMASVRSSVANDSCRQLFEDQVQRHAFVFLDDYLEQILAGPKQGPIIELVKTPGRKKNLPRRTRAATAAAAATTKNTAFLSLDCDGSTKDLPVNSFHKALLLAKERSTQDAPDMSKPPADLLLNSNGSAQRIHGYPKTIQVVDIPQIAVSVEPELQAPAMPLQNQQHPENSTSDSSAPFPPSGRSSELSVIAEGDESPERTHVAIHPPSNALTSTQEELYDIMPGFGRETEEDPDSVMDSKAVAVHYDPQGGPSSDGLHPIPSLANPDHPIPLLSLEVGNHTEPLPSRTMVNSPKDRERNAFTAPLPVVPASNATAIPYTFSVPLNDSSPRAPTHKGGTAAFPMLPAPSPLRKSMRIAQEALAGSAVPTPAPAPVPLGKRTSWLTKAREAKAMEGTSSIPNTSTTATALAFPRVSTAVKRKSGEMLGALPASDWDKDQRKLKVTKSTDIDTVPPVTKQIERDQRELPSVQSELIQSSSTAVVMPVDRLESHTMDVDEQISRLDSAEDGFIDLFKRTVEGLGARSGKSMGKSLGGAAVAALAEARAAAEAKVAERNKVNSETSDPQVLQGDGLLDRELSGTKAHVDEQFSYVPIPEIEGAERRLSLSDLTPDTAESKPSTRTAQAGTRTNSYDDSVSATPPDSPPSKGGSGFVKPAGPVFNKPPPPVFMPPSSKSGYPKAVSLDHPPSQFTLPAAVSLGIPPRFASPSNGLPSLVQGTSQLSIQPTQYSTSSQPVFDDRNADRTWAFSAQDTQYTIDSEPHDAQHPNIIDDDDDSWPLEEKLAAAEPGWRPFDFSNVDKEDTWSSIPTESQGPTRSLEAEKNGDPATLLNGVNVEVETNDEVMDREETVEISDAERSITETSELEEGAVSEASPLRRVEPSARSASRVSTTSDASSSQSRDGFFRQATKLVNSMLGGKKAKPELKSLQLAAAAAKRQQEEADKKTQRLRDMEARRQTAIAKKAEAERARLLEEERKSKEEAEKRKREREENTDKRPLKLPAPTKKAEDDTSKRRKIASETEKKPESKKLSSKDKKDLAIPVKLAVTPGAKLAVQKGAKATGTALVSSTAYNATQNAPSVKPIMPEAKPFKVVPASLKDKAKAKAQEDGMNDKLPSTVVQSQMAARAKAQMQAAKLPTPEVPSESIELPDINSEYSDSEDEDRVRTFDPPDWAQSPELRQALQMQSTVNPDDIFGEIRPVRMEEMFRTRQSRFRARTSSANWSGPDRLTAEEVREYERRMGFQQNQVP